MKKRLKRKDSFFNAYEEKIELILDVMSELVVLQDSNHRILWANKAAGDSVKKDPKALLGRNCFEIWAKRKRVCEKCPVDRALKSGEVEEGEIETSDGRFWLIKGYPIKNDEGKVVNVLEVTSDITKRKKIEQVLRETEELYKTLVDTSPYGITVTDLDGEITFVSKGTLEAHGYKGAEEVIGKKALDLFAPFERKRARVEFSELLKGKVIKNAEYTLLRKDGSTFIGEISASLIKSKEGIPQAFMGCMRDVTKRKEYEKSLKEKEAFNYALFNYSPAETIVVDKKGRIIKTNLAKRRSGNRIPKIGDVMYKDYGGKHEIDMHKELMDCIKRGKGKEFPVMKYKDKYLSISIAPFPEGAIIISEDITERIKAEKALRESEQKFRSIVETLPGFLTITDKEGRNFYVSQNCKEITGYSKEELENKFVWWVHKDDEKKARKVFEEALRNHKGGRNFEYKAIRKDGSVWYASSSWEPMIDEKGVFQGFVLHTIDISDRKLMEEEMLKAQKLESIGILAGGIAHDFNNFLTGILTNLSLARLKINPEDELYDIITESERIAQNAKSLSHQLLVYSKGGVPVKEKASIKELIMESANFVLTGSKSKCNFDFQEDLWEVEIDKGQMIQVMNNLFFNAIEAMPGGGFIYVKAENVEVSEKENLPLEEGKYVKITIKDTGIGIPKEHLSRIFDPFFTTKEKGSGLGLSTVFYIIRKHRGYIYAESELGVGSSFYIYLPAIPEQRERQKIEKKLIEYKGKVLIMDDKSFIRKAAKKALSLLGYEVGEAENGEEAIILYKEAMENREPYDVVILDLTVPGAMGGLKTLKELKKIDPKVKTIVSSGYSDDPVMADYKKFGFDGIIRKPYEYKKLVEVVSALVERK
ncbi:MAG: PAS domain S-box protein [candidate division WOR-3 bacterium]